VYSAPLWFVNQDNLFLGSPLDQGVSTLIQLGKVPKTRVRILFLTPDSVTLAISPESLETSKK